MAAVCAALAGIGAVAARRARPRGHGGSWLGVPHLAGDLVLDGDADDGAWTSPAQPPARTGLFVGDRGERARPASEARLLWGDGHLYVLLYAADEDVRSRGDFFRLTFTVPARGASPPSSFAFDVGPGGPFPQGVHGARDIDGTVDDAHDRDEEWLIELAVPLSPMGLEAAPGEAFGLRLRRCDASANDDAGACAGWGEGCLVLE
jgi:hypothetical protein